MKKLFVPAFCLFHMIAIFWWSLPHSFGGMVATNAEQSTLEAKSLNWMMLDDKSWLYSFLKNYINVTGSQQYWDFFAPFSPRFHQYLSVCDSVIDYPEQGKIACKGEIMFSNLDGDFDVFKWSGTGRSRLYRLTENLVSLDDPILFEAFTQYYRTYQQSTVAAFAPAQLVLHQFELHPGLNDLPKAGYRMDKLLFITP